LVFLLRSLSRVLCWPYFLFSLTPVRGGTYFFCCAKRSKQEKALHTADPKCPPLACSRSDPKGSLPGKSPEAVETNLCGPRSLRASPSVPRYSALSCSRLIAGRISQFLRFSRIFLCRLVLCPSFGALRLRVASRFCKKFARSAAHDSGKVFFNCSKKIRQTKLIESSI